jgi:hypothetical protein
LAQRIAEGDVPSFLADKRILALDLSLIVAGTKYRGQFEERLKTIMKELMENQNAIIFIDELHTLVGAGSAEGSLDAANILKPALSRGEIQCIGATTPAEFRKSIEKDRSLERRFQAVKVPPPNEADAIKILFGIKDRYEKFHAVGYTDEAIETAVYTSSRYIPDRFLPDKAIDLIDEAGARVKLRQTTLPAIWPTSRSASSSSCTAWRTPSPTTSSRRRASIPTKSARSARTCASCARSTTSTIPPPACVTKDDIEDVVARWTGVPMTAHQGRRNHQAAAHRRGAAQAHHQPGESDFRAGARHPPFARRLEVQAPGRPVVPVPGTHRRRQDRSGPRAGRLPVRQREEPGPLRHVGVHGEALGLEADRLASRIRGLRRGRPAHRAREAQSPIPSSCSTKSRRRIRIFTTSCCRCLKTAS